MHTGYALSVCLAAMHERRGKISSGWCLPLRIARRKPSRKQRELVEISLEECCRLLVGDGTIVVDQLGLVGQIDLWLAEHQRSYGCQHGPHLMLPDRGADRAR